MSYTINNITLQKVSKMNIDNCIITGVTDTYEIKDGKITGYDVVNGKIAKQTGVSEII